jgi:uncharacterized protein (DUF2267 family)
MAAPGLQGIDETVERTHVLLNEIAEEMRADKDAAYAALRGVLHAIRDWLTADEAAQFAAQLPMLVRGIFYEGWNPGTFVEHRRDPDAFLDRVAAGERLDREHAARAAHAVGRVLSRHVSRGEWEDVTGALAVPVRDLLA